ncbi:MAG: peptide chain release factor N(5)-glutamine methyltransferase [Dissulfurispiraceae bacterium]
MTALEKLKELASVFERAGIEDAAREAALLITETIGINKATLHACPPDIDDAASKVIDAFAKRRVQGEPIQYIIGHVDFYGLRIHVGKGVLIPRPETELLVEETVNLIKRSGEMVSRQIGLSVLDLCTGSGCIALSIAKSFLQANVYGIDTSAMALEYAKLNAEYNGIRNVTFIEGNLFSPLDSGVCLDFIVSNPPYIRRADIPRLQKEIVHEPIEALDGGEDGLDFYKTILKEAFCYLKKNGRVILEVGFDQAEDIRRLAVSQGFKNIRFVKDYASIDRIFVGSF